MPGADRILGIFAVQKGRKNPQIFYFPNRYAKKLEQGLDRRWNGVIVFSRQRFGRRRFLWGFSRGLVALNGGCLPIGDSGGGRFSWFLGGRFGRRLVLGPHPCVSRRL
jgi:hypothetical protein